MEDFRPVRAVVGGLISAFAITGVAIHASAQSIGTEDIARAALSTFVEAAQLSYLEERCPTLSAQELTKYREHLSTAAGFLMTMAPDAYRAAVANEQAVGSRLIPDRFRDCADAGVADAIRSGYAKAWTATVLINQIPSSYRLPAAPADKPPPQAETAHEIATRAATQFGVAYTIWHLEDRCRTLPTPRRDEYAATIAQTTPLLEAAAPELFQAAIMSAQTRGPALVPNIFPDCAHPEVGGAIEQGARDAQEALTLLRQLPPGYRMVIIN